MKTVGIVQARVGSTRLPGKVLLPAAGRPLIEHLLRRVQRCRSLDALWLATSTNIENDPLADVAAACGVRVFRGSEQDVLSRFHHIAQVESADLVVRLTGDCPLHDPEVIDQVVAFTQAHGDRFDYVTNALRSTYPDGLDVEVCTAAAIAAAHAGARHDVDREHVMPFIHRYHDGPGPFRVGHYAGPADFSHLRWTLDEKEDYELIRRVFETLEPIAPAFGWMDVVALLTREPALLALNGHIARNAGFAPASSAGSGCQL